jgi:cytidyltransferase-like protein
VIHEKTPTIMVSGGLDPLHIGHLSLLRDAARLGHVIIALNSDAWLIRKKGYYLLPWAQRKEILSALSFVHRVVPVDDEDNTVSEAIERERPDYFANGGDREKGNVPEIPTCERIGTQLIWGMGGKDKLAASSDLFWNAVKMAIENGAMIYGQPPTFFPQVPDQNP